MHALHKSTSQPPRPSLHLQDHKRFRALSLCLALPQWSAQPTVTQLSLRSKSGTTIPSATLCLSSEQPELLRQLPALAFHGQQFSRHGHMVKEEPKNVGSTLWTQLTTYGNRQILHRVSYEKYRPCILEPAFCALCIGLPRGSNTSTAFEPMLKAWGLACRLFAKSQRSGHALSRSTL